MEKREGARPKLLRYMIANAGRWVPRSELQEIAGNVGGWERVMRTFRDEGYILDYSPAEKAYRFPFKEPQNAARDDRYISKKVRAMVSTRDNGTCQMCGKTIKSDGIKLFMDHVIPLEWGGETTIENLQALCRDCNEGKKNFVSGENRELMNRVSHASSTKERLRLYFDFYCNKCIGVDKLAVIAKTREWTRAVRTIRAEYDMDIEYIPANKKKGIERAGYIYHKLQEKEESYEE